MGIFLFVPLKVDFEVALGRKAVATYVTLEGPLTSMRAQVDLQGTVTTKHLGTESTLMLEEWVLGAWFCVEHRHVGGFSLAMLHQSREWVQSIGRCCYAGKRVGEDHTAGRAVRYQW